MKLSLLSPAEIKRRTWLLLHSPNGSVAVEMRKNNEEKKKANEKAMWDKRRKKEEDYRKKLQKQREEVEEEEKRKRKQDIKHRVAMMIESLYEEGEAEEEKEWWC